MSNTTLDLNQLRRRLFEVAAKSPCAKRKVGCIIAAHDGPWMEDGVPTQYRILAEGFNYNPNGGSCEIGVNEVTQRLITSPDVIHAEVAAVDAFLDYTKASGTYFSPDELTLFVTYMPCQDCQEYARRHHFETFTLMEEIDMSGQTDHAKMLEERGARYGKFSEHAKIATDLKERMHTATGWQRLHPDQKEALDMIQHKIARILNGDPDYKDNWDDIVGYAKLCSDEIL